MRKRISPLLARTSLRPVMQWIRSWMKAINRQLHPVNWHDLRRVEPLCRDFGFNRGTPINRHYIEGFLQEHRTDIQGHVLEIANARYTRKFGGDQVTQSDILHVDPTCQAATILGDLSTGAGIPKDAFDCIILTETLFCIFDLRATIANLVAALKPGGVALITTAGIAQISKHDADRWGDYWRLTTMSLRSLLTEVVPADHISIKSYGNVLTAVAQLHGIVLEDLTTAELDHQDPEFEVTVVARVTRPL